MSENTSFKEFLKEKEKQSSNTEEINFSFHKTFDQNINSDAITKEEIIEKIKTVEDPEIPINLYDLGLIYNIDIDEKNNIAIKMTLTNPNCPVAAEMPENVGKAVSSLNNLSSVKVDLIWDPKWSKEMMSEEAKLALDVY
tara:strand:+ start:113 stop:532 length:420 start_codon:yes stop_codon:yes gene_type:complete